MQSITEIRLGPDATGGPRAHIRPIAAMLSAPELRTPGERAAHWRFLHECSDHAEPFDYGPGDAHALIDARDTASFAAIANLIGLGAGILIACLMAATGVWSS